MKGVSFQNGIEFKISIDGESWVQGGVLNGKLESVVRNGGASAPLYIFLANGIDKKIKQKTVGAFQILERKTAETGPIDWSFDLLSDARISDKTGSLYIAYGGCEILETLGQLKLNILPHPYIQDVFSLMNTNYRFVLKGILYAKNGMVEASFEAPATKDWASLEELILLMRVKENVACNFQFYRKVVDATKGGLSSKIMKREFEQNWNVKNIIHDFNNRVNKDVVTEYIDNIIAEYRNTGWLQSEGA